MIRESLDKLKKYIRLKTYNTFGGHDDGVNIPLMPLGGNSDEAVEPVAEGPIVADEDTSYGSFASINKKNVLAGAAVLASAAAIFAFGYMASSLEPDEHSHETGLTTSSSPATTTPEAVMAAACYQYLTPILLGQNASAETEFELTLSPIDDKTGTYDLSENRKFKQFISITQAFGSGSKVMDFANAFLGEVSNASGKFYEVCSVVSRLNFQYNDSSGYYSLTDFDSSPEVTALDCRDKSLGEGICARSFQADAYIAEVHEFPNTNTSLFKYVFNISNIGSPEDQDDRRVARSEAISQHADSDLLNRGNIAPRSLKEYAMSKVGLQKDGA